MRSFPDRRSWLGVVLGAFLACVACTPVDLSGEPPKAIDVEVRAEPVELETGQPATFTVDAFSKSGVIVATAIEFEEDGVWDERQRHNSQHLITTYTHAYAAVGEYTADVWVRDSNDSHTEGFRTVRVHDPVLRLVSARALAAYDGPYWNGQRAGACYAIGPPLGGTVPLDAGGLAVNLGDLPRGATVAFTQVFGQDRWATTPSGDAAYSCAFTLTLREQHWGVTTPFAPGSCATSSITDPYDPARLQCTIVVNAVVP